MKIIIHDIVDRNIKSIDIIEKNCIESDLKNSYKYAINYSVEKDRIGIFKKILNKSDFYGNKKGIFEKTNFKQIPKEVVMNMIKFSSYRIFDFIKNKISFNFINLFDLFMINIKSKSDNKYKLIESLLEIYHDNNYDFNILLELFIINDDSIYINTLWMKYKNKLLNNFDLIYLDSCKENKLHLLNWILDINSTYNKINHKNALRGFNIACQNDNIDIILRIEQEIHINHIFPFTIASNSGYRIFKRYFLKKIYSNTVDEMFIEWIKNLKIYTIKIHNFSYGIMVKLRTVNSTSYESIPNRILNFSVKDFYLPNKLKTKHFNTKLKNSLSNKYMYVVSDKYYELHVTIIESKFIDKILLEDINKNDKNLLLKIYK